MQSSHENCHFLPSPAQLGCNRVEKHTCLLSVFQYSRGTGYMSVGQPRTTAPQSPACGQSLPRLQLQSSRAVMGYHHPSASDRKTNNQAQAQKAHKCHPLSQSTAFTWWGVSHLNTEAGLSTSQTNRTLRSWPATGDACLWDWLLLFAKASPAWWHPASACTSMPTAMALHRWNTWSCYDAAYLWTQGGSLPAPQEPVGFHVLLPGLINSTLMSASTSQSQERGRQWSSPSDYGGGCAPVIITRLECATSGRRHASFFLV